MSLREGAIMIVQKIAAVDFDNNVADTFTPSPRGRGVHEGYRFALEEMFGHPELLKEIGGLKNRAPGEVITAVLGLHASFKEHGLQYYYRRRAELQSYVPRGKGIRTRRATLEQLLHETLVRVRLEYLIPEIGEEWPKPFDGVFDAIDELHRCGYVVAIVSSGHDVFIRRSFRQWDRRAPEIIVTDDDMRALGLPTEESCKPHPNVVNAILRQAAHSTVLCSVPVEHRVAVVIGDCELKDRMLAKNAGIGRFGWFNPHGREAPADFGEGEFQFKSWREVTSYLN